MAEDRSSSSPRQTPRSDRNSEPRESSQQQSPPPVSSSSRSPSGSVDERKLSAAVAAATEAAAAAADSAAAAAAAEGKPAMEGKGSLAMAFSLSQRAPSTKSQVSFSEAGTLPKKTRMTSGQFLSFRQRSSTGFLLPSTFFQSQEDIRTWGVEDLTDPSIQPYDKGAEGLPSPFHTSLPGYAPRLCRYVVVSRDKAPRDPFLGPEVTVFPPTWVPQWKPNPNFKEQKYGYNWEDSEAFKMERLPYVNAEFDPVSAEVTHMYSQCYPYTAYPYGVPRVA